MFSLCSFYLPAASVLPGVTRDSLLELCREWNEFKVSERYPTMPEIKRAIAENRVRYSISFHLIQLVQFVSLQVKQIFGAGTACVVSPVGRILYRNPHTKQYEELQIPTMTAGNLMQRLYSAIIEIQYGRIDMPGWTRIVC